MKNHNMSSVRSVRPAPVEIVHKHMRFLIIHNPDKNGMEHFIKELKQRQIKEVVRVCEPTYDAAVLKQEDIEVMDMAFDDGGVPSSEIIDQWLALLKMRFKETPKSCVAVHCVAGLGRAPLMVALALMEAGMTYEDAVAFVREKRRGAINAKQLNFLERYKPRLRMKAKNGSKGESCCLM